MSQLEAEEVEERRWEKSPYRGQRCDAVQVVIQGLFVAGGQVSRGKVWLVGPAQRGKHQLLEGFISQARVLGCLGTEERLNVLNSEMT